MVVNDAFGKPELLPFDLRPRRIISYHMPEIYERATERKILESKLTQALIIVLKELDSVLPEETVQTLSLAEQAQVAIKARNPEQFGLLRQYMNELANKIKEMNPEYAYLEEERCHGQLVNAINLSTPLVTEFAQLAETIAIRDTIQVATIMYKGFENILNLYTYAPDYQGPQRGFEPDLARFLGHELLVIFISYLLQNDKWKLITEILDEDLYARITSRGQPTMVSFYHLSELVRLLPNPPNPLGLKPNSPHANLLKERHTKGELAKLIPMEQFMEADYFLFLKAQIQSDVAEELPLWMPWSSLHIHQIPRYLQAAKHYKHARLLLAPLGVKDIETLRLRLVERTGSLEKGWGYTPSRPWDNIIAGFDFSTIGTL